MRAERSLSYTALWVFALAFGWIEAAVVVYLREVHLRELALRGTSDFAGLQVTLVSLPDRLVGMEMVREVCTIILLSAGAWLAGRRGRDRAGAFLLSFGIWDLTYYAVLKGVAHWPNSLTAWDILFLIPLPWVAPVWAPIVIATLFVGAGTYLFWTAEREKSYRWTDAAILMAAAVLTTTAFLVEARAAIDHRAPQHFPVWLFSAGVVLAAAWFVHVERRRRPNASQRQWLGVRVRAIVPEPVGVSRGPTAPGDVSQLISHYTEARQRRDALLREAGEVSERFERLAHGLTAHPERMIIGLPESAVDDPGKWDVVPSYPLPAMETLSKLTEDIRDATATAERLSERLILLGRSDVVQQPDAFFH